ncbi:hypothetical protein [Cupriavidus necator]|nr:hypothetical protein [Cupriavidus necator]
MVSLVYLVVMALAFLGAVALGTHSNYRWMKQQAEESLSDDKLR